MAKVKITKGKARMTKRNLARTFMNSLIILNALATTFIALNLYGILDLI